MKLLCLLTIVLSTIAIFPQKVDSTSIENPCNDKVLNQLKSKDSLTVEEMKIYVELKRDCDEYLNNQSHTTAHDTTLLFGFLTAIAVAFAIIVFML